jgi:hypothetical protein
MYKHSGKLYFNRSLRTDLSTLYSSRGTVPICIFVSANCCATWNTPSSNKKVCRGTTGWFFVLELSWCTHKCSFNMWLHFALPINLACSFSRSVQILSTWEQSGVEHQARRLRNRNFTISHIFLFAVGKGTVALHLFLARKKPLW